MTPQRPRRRAASSALSNEKLALIVADHARGFRQTDDFREALQLIEPTSERRAQCEDDVDRAALGVRIAELIEPPSPGIHKEYLSDIVKKLKAVENTVFLPASLKNQQKMHRESYEKFADTILVKPGSRRPSNTKRIATHFAHELLKKYGSRPPGVTIEGNWQKLATILYGRNRDANLFEYVRSYRKFAPQYADAHEMWRGLDKLMCL